MSKSAEPYKETNRVLLLIDVSLLFHGFAEELCVKYLRILVKIANISAEVQADGTKKTRIIMINHKLVKNGKGNSSKILQIFKY